MAQSKIKETAKEWGIPAKGEFRFEVAFSETVSLKVILALLH